VLLSSSVSCKCSVVLRFVITEHIVDIRPNTLNAKWRMITVSHGKRFYVSSASNEIALYLDYPRSNFLVSCNRTAGSSPAQLYPLRTEDSHNPSQPCTTDSRQGDVMVAPTY
jgi:hypothetical protein